MRERKTDAAGGAGDDGDLVPERRRVSLRRRGMA
jgi:hypothetical protein